MKLENIYKHPISSLISVGMLIYTFYLVHIGQETLTSALPIIGFALYGLGKKDPNGGVPFSESVGPMLLFLVLSVSFSSCRQLRKSQKSIQKDSTSTLIRNRAVDVKVEGAQLSATVGINCDSLGNVQWNEGFIAGMSKYFGEWAGLESKQTVTRDGNILVVKNQNGSFAKMKLDSSGRLSITTGCDSLLRLAHVQDSVIRTWKEEVNEVVVEKEVRFIPWWLWCIVGILAFLVAFLGLKTILFRP